MGDGSVGDQRKLKKMQDEIQALRQDGHGHRDPLLVRRIRRIYVLTHIFFADDALQRISACKNCDKAVRGRDNSTIRAGRGLPLPRRPTVKFKINI